MFGYLHIDENELKIKDFKRYRAFYCGVCEELKGFAGLKARTTLTYDMTFLAILLNGLYDLESQTLMKRCGVHISKHPVIVNEACTYAAHMNILLTYANLRDKFFDSRNVPALLASLLFLPKVKKLRSMYPKQAEAVDNYMLKLHEAEISSCNDIEYAAGLTGDMLGTVFAYKDDEWHETLYKTGFFLGKFVYLADAAEDYEKDSRKRAYNPFLLSGIESVDKRKEILYSVACEASRYFERLPITDNIEILRNVIYRGIWNRFKTRDDVTSKNKGGNNERSL